MEGEFWWKVIRPQGLVFGIVCEVRTQDPENFDEEVKSLLTACRAFSQVPFFSFARARKRKETLERRVCGMEEEIVCNRW